MYFWKYILAKKAGLSQQKCNMALYGLPVLPIAEAVEKTVTGNPITITDAIAEDALSLQVAFEPSQDGTPSIDSEPTTEPYLSKVIPRGNKEYYSLVGGTVAWNQLVGTNTTTVPTIINRKYLTVINGIQTITNGDGNAISVTGGTDNVHDLTQMFGSTIADYVYSLEQQTAGSGIAWLKSYGFFTKDYYPYNAGELISVKTSAHKVGSTSYPIDNIDLRGLFKLDSANKLYCDGDTYPPSGNVSRKYGIVDLGTLPWTAQALSGNRTAFYTNWASWSNPPKWETGVPTNAITTLVSKCVSQQADSWGSDVMVFTKPVGTLPGYVLAFIFDDTKYADATAFSNAVNGVYLVYEQATPTTETLTPYTSPINIEAGGTEEFIDNRTVPIPVGNETYYASEYEVKGKTGVTVNHSATEGDTPTEYEVEFTQQGTIYGGTVDIVTGVLTMTWGHADLGLLNWEKSGNDGLFFDRSVNSYMKMPETMQDVTSAMCQRYPSSSYANHPDKTMYMTWQTAGIKYIAIIDSRYADYTVNEFKNAVNGVPLVYELTTPQVYNLTPQQVTMLLGNNYLETEDGTITITYMARK